MDIVKFTKDNTFQRIKAWYIDETSVELTPAEEKKKDRLKHIWALRCNNRYSPKDAVRIIERDYKVSQATAYRDYSLSMELFGSMDQVNLAAEKMIIAEGYWKLHLSALKNGKDEVALRALEKYESLYNFEDTAQKVDPKKLEASVYNLKIPRGAEKMLMGMFETGVLNFNNLGAEDVQWKENSEDDQDEQNEEEYE